MQTYAPGTRIGQYEIASRPMMGGMGVVYFALDHGNDGRPVALKTFRPELLPDRAARDRFLREGTAWIELGSHPHIVRCYKVEYIDPTAFLVLELIAKEQKMPDASLRSWLIPGQPLPIEQALLFALQIARGMQHATEKIPGFVHRDLKPENILVGVDKLPGTNINRLRVTDFGLVKTIVDSGASRPPSNEDQLKTNQIQFTRGVGTPLYMAPEQWVGEPAGVFTDVYAFGCILYEILTGHHAAEGKTIAELQESHCDGKLQLIPSNLSKDLDLVLTKCLAKNPNGRYDNWAELTDLIEHSYLKQSGMSVPSLADLTPLSVEERMQASWSYNAIGVAFHHIGRTEAAMGYFEKALDIAHEIGNRSGEGSALGNLGIVHDTLGNVQRAIDYFNQCLIILRELGDRDSESTVLGSLGNAYIALADSRRAIDCFEQSLAIKRAIGDREKEGATLSSLGIAYIQLGDPRRAIEHLKRSLAISREIGDRRGEGTAVGHLGAAYFQLGDVKRAIDDFEEYLEIAQVIGDRKAEGTALGNLGGVYVQQGDARAIEYLEHALVIDREVGNRREEATALGNLGSAYVQQGDTRRALEVYEQALIIRKEIGAIDLVASTSFNMARLYTLQGNTTRALSLAQEAARMYAEIGHSEYTQRAQQLIAHIQAGAPSQASITSDGDTFEAFMRATSQQAMQAAVERYPMLKEEQFIRRIEKFMKEQVSLELRPAFEQHLAWLKQIAGKQQSSLFARLLGKKG